MTSHHVTCHVTSLSRAFFIVFQKKRKEKSEKIQENKIKIVSVQMSHNKGTPKGY